MRIIVRQNGIVTRMWQQAPLETDLYYDMSDHPDYQFIIRRQGTSRRPSNVVIIQIATRPTETSKKRKTVQTGRIQMLSMVDGRDSDTGAPREHVYTVDLNPEQHIWPITDLVDQLLKLDVNRQQITPMDEGATLYDNCAVHSNPHMLTDGNLTQTPNPGGDPHGLAGEDLPPSVDFTVKEASWAILHFPDGQLSGGVSHLYLWPQAADKAEEITGVVQKLQADEDAVFA